VSVPIKLLHEGEGHTVTVELKSGEIYRGLLNESEDSMNCQMSNVTMTARDGRVSRLEQVYLRGSMIRMVILPDILKNAPMFKRVQQLKKGKEAAAGGKGRGRGRGRGGGR
jgi:small nuclear ribonucleoprotein D3